MVALVLGVFAYVIVDSQRQDRDDVEQRFEDVAQVSAAVTEGIFGISLAGSAQQAATRFGEAEIDPAALEEYAAQSQLDYAVVLDEDGKRLAATSKAPRDAGMSEAAMAAVDTGQPAFSDVLGEGGDSVVELAVEFPSASGSRVYVSGTPTSAFAKFLAGFLGKVPNFADSESLMIDSDGTVLGGANFESEVGSPLEDKELLEAALGDEKGGYGDNRYFASAPISGSPFRVVLDAAEDDLYEDLGGSRTTIPWVLFAAFALAAALGLFLLRRATLAGAELQRRALNERHAVEINDNIIQGLALAKYQLEAGQDEASATQVSETLREAQRLVSGLLGDAEVQAGQLRREVAAETSRPDQRDEPSS